MLLLSRAVGIDFENNLAVVDSTEAAVPEDHFPEDMEETQVIESTLDQQEETLPQDVTYSFAVLFVLGIIVGLLVFSILSRKWN